jgi:DNA-binding transcriptional ArsR family regulator
VGAELGIHFEALAEAVEVEHGTLEHHLDRLVDAGLVIEHRAHGYRCLFLPGEQPARVQRALTAVRAPTALELLRTLADGPATVSKLAGPADVSRSTASYHLSRLESADLVSRRPAGRSTEVRLTELGDHVLALRSGP